MRLFGRSRLNWMLEGERFKSIDDRLSTVGLWIIVALRVNPLTSSDLVSYAAGLTKMPTWKVMLGTALGMAPFCWAQAYLADELLSAFPNLVYPLIILCVVYFVIAAAAICKLVTRKHSRVDETEFHST